MPRYDPELIAALAEGRLDPDEAAELTRQIADDPNAMADLAGQRTALEAAAAAPRPALTDPERTQLRAAVADALGITTPEPAAPGVRRVPWGSLGIAAAALAALVAVVPVVGLLSTGGTDSASLELAAEAATTVSTTAPETRAAAVEEAPAVIGDVDANDALISGEASDEGVAGFGSSTTHAPATTKAVPTTQAVTTTSAEPATETSVGAAPETIAPELGRLTEELTSLRAEPDAVQGIAEAATEGDTCWVEDTSVRADPPPERYRFIYDNGDLTVIVYYAVSDGEIGPFQVWGLPDCANLVVIP